MNSNSLSVKVISDWEIQYPLFESSLFEKNGFVLSKTESNISDEELIIVKAHKSTDVWKTRCNGTIPNEISWAFRSVVYNKSTGKIVAIAPVSKLETQEFNVNDENVIQEEFQDGVMINVFNQKGNWVISSRSRLWATCKFSSTRLFSDLFMEAKEKMGLDFDMLNNSERRTYTFVLQHPENPLTPGKKTHKPSMRLVSVQTIRDDNVVVFNDVHDKLIQPFLNTIPNTILANQVETDFDVSNLDSGYVLKRGWKRIRVLNNNYEKRKMLRGNSPSLLNIRLKSIVENTVFEQKEMFPEEVEELYILENDLNLLFTELHQLQLERRVKKSIQHDNLPHWSRKLIFILHGDQLKTKRAITGNERMKECFKDKINDLAKGMKMWRKEILSKNVGVNE